LSQLKNSWLFSIYSLYDSKGGENLERITNCWAKNKCKKWNEEESNCFRNCIGFQQLQALYLQSNMPKRYQKFIPLSPMVVDIEAFMELKAFQDSIVEHVNKGEGVFIYSNTKGNGKTTWATKIMNEYFLRVALRNNLRCRGVFIYVPDFFELKKKSFGEEAESFHELERNIRKADLVIFDDIGAEKMSEWTKEQFLLLVNERYMNMKSCIFTSNVDVDTLKTEAFLGERAVSRILGMSKVVEFKSNVDAREVNL
jgi:DNA replication protein DnaC